MSSTVVPAVCYDVCNAAYVEAQSKGKSPELCEANSKFLQSYDNCSDCIDQRSDDPDSVDREYLEPEFGQFINYCNGTSNGPTSSAASGGPTSSAPGIPTSWLTVSTTLHTTELTLLGNAPTTIVQVINTTVTRSDWTGFVTGPTASNSEPTETVTSKAWIAGPVIGSIAGFALIFTAVAMILRRRGVLGGRRGPGAELDGDSSWRTGDKPELEAKEAAKVMPQELNPDWGPEAGPHELSAATPPTEMPNDVAASELPARREGVPSSV